MNTLAVSLTYFAMILIKIRSDLMSNKEISILHVNELLTKLYDSLDNDTAKKRIIK